VQQNLWLLLRIGTNRIWGGWRRYGLLASLLRVHATDYRNYSKSQKRRVNFVCHDMASLRPVPDGAYRGPGCIGTEARRPLLALRVICCVCTKVVVSGAKRTWLRIYEYTRWPRAPDISFPWRLDRDRVFAKSILMRGGRSARPPDVTAKGEERR
jgi:hypothetical protein